MTILTQGKRPWGFVLSEAAGHRSRDNLLIGASQSFGPGAVLAKLAATTGITASLIIGAGNTGNGVLTLASPAYSSAAKPGRYRIVCIEPITNGGKFSVEDPAGVNIGVATVGSAFTKQVKFTIADGATDFIAGDEFSIDVLKGDGAGEVFVLFNQDGTDGSEIPAAVAGYGAVTGVSETAKIAGITRDAEVNKWELVWPIDITADEKALATRLLADVGILAR